MNDEFKLFYWIHIFANQTLEEPQTSRHVTALCCFITKRYQPNGSGWRIISLRKFCFPLFTACANLPVRVLHRSCKRLSTGCCWLVQVAQRQQWGEQCLKKQYTDSSSAADRAEAWTGSCSWSLSETENQLQNLTGTAGNVCTAPLTAYLSEIPYYLSWVIRSRTADLVAINVNKELDCEHKADSDTQIWCVQSCPNNRRLSAGICPQGSTWVETAGLCATVKINSNVKVFLFQLAFTLLSCNI